MRILVPFCRGVPGLGFYQDFHRGVTDALRELGHDPVVPSFAAVGEAAERDIRALALHLSSGDIDALLDLCCWSCALSESVPGLFESSDIPWAGMLFDQPYNQLIHAIRARRLFATYPDLGHPEQTRSRPARCGARGARSPRSRGRARRTRRSGTRSPTPCSQTRSARCT